jgi:hypothetical protein
MDFKQGHCTKYVQRRYRSGDAVLYCKDVRDSSRVSRANKKRPGKPVGNPGRFAIFTPAMLSQHRRANLSSLDRRNRVGAGTLRAAAFGVGDALAFLERIKLTVFDGRVMEEQFSLFALDEAKAFVRNQLLDRAFCHLQKLPKRNPKQTTKTANALLRNPGNNARQSYTTRDAQVDRDERTVRGSRKHAI